MELVQFKWDQTSFIKPSDKRYGQTACFGIASLYVVVSFANGVLACGGHWRLRSSKDSLKKSLMVLNKADIIIPSPHLN